MAIYNQQQLNSASVATYFTNTYGGISASAVRDLNNTWISSSALLTGSNTFNGNQTIFGDLRQSSSFSYFYGSGSYGTIAMGPNLAVYDPGNGGYGTINSTQLYLGKVKDNIVESGSQFPGINILVDPYTDPANVYASVQLVEPISGNPFVSYAANSYTPEFFGEVIGWIGGGGLNDAGTNTAIIMRTGSADMYVYKPTRFNYNVNVISGALSVGDNPDNGQGSQFPSIQIVCDNQLYPGNVYAGFNMVEANLGTMVNLFTTTYTTAYSGKLVSGLGGPNVPNALVSGSPDAIIFPSGSPIMELWKPTTFKYNQVVSGSSTMLGGLYVSSSNQYDVVVNGQMYISSSGTTATTRPLILISGSAGSGGTNTIRNNNIDISSPGNQAYVRVTNAGTGWNAQLAPAGLVINGGGIIALTANTSSFSSPTLYGNNGVSDVAVLQLSSNVSASLVVDTTATANLILSYVSSSLNFTDDSAAAAGGVPLGGVYRNGNFLMIRLT